MSKLRVNINMVPQEDIYLYKKDVIKIKLSKDDLLDDTIGYADCYSRWQNLIIHEMIHEYEHKMNPNVVDYNEIKRLRGIKNMSKMDHGDKYFQSIIIVSNLLEKDINRFILGL